LNLNESESFHRPGSAYEMRLMICLLFAGGYYVLFVPAFFPEVRKG
jgi:hypothetical protein